MLSLLRISRHLDASQPDRLWADLAQSGMTWPLPLRVRLESVPAAAWSLALRRVCELTHGPTALARHLTDRLLHCQQPHGPWTDDTGRPDALLTALAAAALRRRLLQPGLHPEHAEQLRHAHAAALAALADLQNPEDGLFGDPQHPVTATTVGRTPIRAAEACFILFLLAEDPAALDALRLLPLRDALETAAPGFDATLRETHDMANLLLDTPALIPVPALAA